MPRKSREKSSTGIYHVMLRGINRQDIFNDEEDKIKYIEILKRYKEISEYEVYGYCLMSNHIHLLIKEVKEEISQVMKRISVSYVYWYNIKYERSGHLFQDRYKSEKVEDDRYLMVVLRYIHQNLLKARMVDNIDEYKWSSYRGYIESNNELIDIKFILNILSDDNKKAIELFKKYMNEANEDKCLDMDIGKKKRITDEEIKAIIRKVTRLNNPQALQQMNKRERDYIIKKLKDEGISIRQLARITGLGRGIIEKA